VFGKRKKITEFDQLPEKDQSLMLALEIPEGDRRLLIGHLERFVRKYPNYLFAQLNLPALHLELGEIEKAEVGYQGVLERFPKEAGAVAGLATVYLEKKDYEKAEEFAERALAMGYEWAGVLAVLAQIYELRGEAEKAAEHYLRAYKIQPHGWNYLEKFCEFKKRRFVPPTEKSDGLLDIKHVEDL